MRLLLILLALIQPLNHTRLRHRLPIRRVLTRKARTSRPKKHLDPLAECACSDQYAGWLSTT